MSLVKVACSGDDVGDSVTGEFVLAAPHIGRPVENALGDLDQRQRLQRPALLKILLAVLRPEEPLFGPCS